MRFFLDTANLDELKIGAGWGILDGCTTNPSLIAKEGVKFEDRVRQITEIVDGDISAEVLSACAEWPELRRYLLRPELLATRNLERLRNQLNTQQRWESWVNRPIQIYESRRPLFQLKAGSIACIDLTEPRDNELRQLGWWPQLITLLLESRDALAPQLQALLNRLGQLLVLLLTQVIGRAIGLVGRGILQGLGRGVSRDRTAQ